MEKRSLISKIKNEYAGRTYAALCGLLIIIITVSIIVFIFSKGINTFVKDKYPLFNYLFSSSWKPDAAPDTGGPQFGILTFLLGSVCVSLGAVILSTPISIALAVFMNLISPGIGKKILTPAMELFVGIPSVVYGWIGVVLLVPFIRDHFGGIGFSLLAGIIVLSIMILPTVTSISSDAIKSIPEDYIEASYGLGATRWQTIIRVIIPAASGGIETGIVLGLARAFGEALAVQMVIGNSINIPNGLLNPASTLTSILTMDMANTIFGTAWNNALWSMALVLLVVSFMFIFIIRLIGRRRQF